MSGQVSADIIALLEHVRREILDHALIRPGDRVLCAVSGGLDSMTLLDCLAALAPELGFSLVVASLDHGLRGAQSRAECELVAARSRELGLECRTGKVDTGAHCARTGLTVQEAARELRYAFLRSACRELGANRLALAHHRDDQAETVLMRLLSGSGLPGLAGMHYSAEEGFLIRPLLGIPRHDLEQYARARGLVWAEDPSNASTKYFRNRLRLELIPSIERNADPLFRERLDALGEACTELDSILESLAESRRAAALLPCAPDEAAFSCAALAALPTLLRRHIIRGAVRRSAGPDTILSGRPLAALERLVLCGPSGRRLDLPYGLGAQREFDRLRVAPAERLVVSAGLGMEGETALCLNRRTVVSLPGVNWELELQPAAWDESQAGALLRDSRALEAVFDLDALELPLSAGAWREGERITPFGATGGRKLKKAFLEARVPAGRRGSVPVVRDAAGRVIWAPGVARSALAPVNSSTRRALEIRARELHEGVSDTSDQH
ncbi:tRNA lysidine(34) synthetase TilS [bacterium]|nr:tRNA lysidine(34) synthetase TilS [bacterium]